MPETKRKLRSQEWWSGPEYYNFARRAWLRAEGFARDNPNCETHIVDAGHFPLDEVPDVVSALHMAFLDRYLA